MPPCGAIKAQRFSRNSCLRNALRSELLLMTPLRRDYEDDFAPAIRQSKRPSKPTKAVYCVRIANSKRERRELGSIDSNQSPLYIGAGSQNLKIPSLLRTSFYARESRRSKVPPCVDAAFWAQYIHCLLHLYNIWRRLKEEARTKLWQIPGIQ